MFYRKEGGALCAMKRADAVQALHSMISMPVVTRISTRVTARKTAWPKTGSAWNNPASTARVMKKINA